MYEFYVKSQTFRLMFIGLIRIFYNWRKEKMCIDAKGQNDKNNNANLVRRPN